MRDIPGSGLTEFGQIRGLYLNNNDPVSLTAPAPLALRISQKLRVVRDGESDRRSWTIALLAYNYVLLIPNGPEICSYQWDPEGISPVTYPHLHIGRGATGKVTTFGPRGLHRIHFPTRHITIEDVLRLAIIEFGVEPRRPDWEHILSDS